MLSAWYASGAFGPVVEIELQPASGRTNPLAPVFLGGTDVE